MALQGCDHTFGPLATQARLVQMATSGLQSRAALRVGFPTKVWAKKGTQDSLNLPGGALWACCSSHLDGLELVEQEHDA